MPGDWLIWDCQNGWRSDDFGGQFREMSKLCKETLRIWKSGNFGNSVKETLPPRIYKEIKKSPRNPMKWPDPEGQRFLDFSTALCESVVYRY